MTEFYFDDDPLAGAAAVAAAPAPPPPPPPLSLVAVDESPAPRSSVAVAGWARYLHSERNMTASTVFTYEHNVRRVERFIGKPREHLDMEDVRRFFRESPYHPATKNGCLVAIKSFHRWGVLEGLWETSGIVAMQGPKIVRNPKPSLSARECRWLLVHCRRPAEYRLIYFGLFAGLRITESALIGPNEWRDDRLRFEGKGRKVREVPVHPELQARRDVILSTSTSRGNLRHVARSLSFTGDVDFTSHALRRSFSVALSEASVSRDIIGALLGHAPLSVTERYTPVRFSELQAAISQLSYDEGAW